MQTIRPTLGRVGSGHDARRTAREHGDAISNTDTKQRGDGGEGGEQTALQGIAIDKRCHVSSPDLLCAHGGSCLRDACELIDVPHASSF